MDYKTMTIEEIIEWCKEHKETKWLKEAAAKTVSTKVYPKVKVRALDDNGNPAFTKSGKPKFKTVNDTTKKPTTEKRPISFIELKKEFCQKFMPEILPKAKAKKPTFYDMINSL